MTLSQLEGELRALSVACYLNTVDETDTNQEDTWNDLHRTIHVIAEHVENLKNQELE